MPSRLILVEGIPGSGKSHIAEWISGQLTASGIDSKVHPEVPPDRSVIDGALMSTSHEAGYTYRCIERWRSFVTEVLAEPRCVVRVVEGSFFQSTVRFLLEHNHPGEEVQHYMSATERALAPLAPCLLYLVHSDAPRYLREQLVARKGPDVVSRIAAYTESTAWAKERKLLGMDALAEFYSHYRRVCDDLVEECSMPTLIEDTSSGDWSKLKANVGGWLQG